MQVKPWQACRDRQAEANHILFALLLLLMIPTLPESNQHRHSKQNGGGRELRGGRSGVQMWVPSLHLCCVVGVLTTVVPDFDLRLALFIYDNHAIGSVSWQQNGLRSVGGQALPYSDANISLNYHYAVQLSTHISTLKMCIKW